MTTPSSIGLNASSRGLMRLSGLVSLVSAVVSAVALAFLIAMFVAFGVGAASAGRAFGAINDGLILVAYLLAAPGVVATMAVLHARRPGLDHGVRSCSHWRRSPRSRCCNGSWSSAA